MKRKVFSNTTMGLGIVMALITGVIGFVIIDAVIAPTINSGTINDESHTIIDIDTLVTLNSPPLQRIIQVTNGTDILVTSGNYSIHDLTLGQINISTYDNDTYGNTLQFSYEYTPAEYFENSISRIIIRYIVPIGLLGILGMAAFLA